MKMVTVPFDLLKEVLDKAENDNLCVEHETACTPQHHDEHDREREKIDELRKAAGIATE